MAQQQMDIAGVENWSCLSPSSPQLPAILCLHGYGTNAAILRYQLRQLTQTLGNTFRFVFVEGPFHVQNPGPGVPSTFMDARPFRRWHSDKTLAAVFGVSDGTLREERLQVRQLLHDTLQRERDAGAGIIGLMAFSQGAGLAAALCLDEELGRNIQFAVIICALYPAVSLAEEDGTAVASRLIKIPSIHVQGKADTWKGQGTKVLQQYFEPANVKRIELSIGHEVPSKPKDAAVIIDEVLSLWKRLSNVEKGMV